MSGENQPSKGKKGRGQKGKQGNNIKTKVPKAMPKAQKRKVNPQSLLDDKSNFKSIVPPIRVANAEIPQIQIVCVMDSTSQSAFPLAIISQIASKVASIDSMVYGTYAAMINDQIQVMAGAKDALEQRLTYVNDLFGSMRPKIIKTKFSSYAYKWEAPPISFPPPNILTVRGFNYYFAQPTGADTNANVPQIWSLIPTGISIDEANANYGQLIGNAAGKTDARNLIAPVPTPYERDISIFAQSAVYWGGGAGPAGGPFVSVEAELPFRIGVLAGFFCNFNATPPSRVSNFLKRAAGDSCAAFGYPFIPGFLRKHYRTINQPRFKFIDFAEIFTVMVNWLASAITKSIQLGNKSFVLGTTFTPIPMGAFIVALRQSVMTMFSDSQIVGQFQTYDTFGGFEPFRLGTNCVPRLDKTLIAPTYLVENLRMLLPQVFENVGEKYHNSRNCILYIPVIGLPTNFDVWTGASYMNADGSTQNLFVLDGTEAISLIDGNLGGDIINLNSQYYQAAIAVWNNWATLVEDTSGTISEFEGSPPKFSLLTLTRYINDINFGREKDAQAGSKAPINGWPTWCPLPRGIERKEVKRQTSKKDLKPEFEYVYSNGNEHLANEIDVSISSVTSLSKEIMGIVPTLILPKIRAYAAGGDINGSSISKFQSSYSEHYLYRETTSTDTTLSPNNRQTWLVETAQMMAPGVAKDGASEIERNLIQMQKWGEGGFLNQVLGFVGDVADKFLGF